MRVIARVVLFCSVAVAAWGENWPQFRGPRGDGTSVERNVPVSWSATENVAWSADVPGEGHSSPIVWEGKVFLTSAEGTRRVLLAYDSRNGKLLWRTTVLDAEKEYMHRENSPASSTLATDGVHLFTSFQSGDRVDLRCYDFGGKLIWAEQPLQFEGEHGYSYSPIVYQDLLIFDCRQEGEAATLGIEKATGKIRWRSTPGRKRISHITPLIVPVAGKDQLVVSGSDETAAYEPLTGKMIWHVDGPSDVAVSGLCFGLDMVFTTAGYPSRSRMAVRINPPDSTEPATVAWKFNRQASYVPSPVYHEGHLYSVLDEGMFYCFKAGTGEPVWDHRLTGRFRSSLLLADGNIYATSDKGVTTVLKASSTGYQEISRNELGAFCYTTPALSNSRLFIRTDRQLHCIVRND